MTEAAGTRVSSARMPAEWEAHEGCLMAWPARRDMWGSLLEQACHDYATVAAAIARYEPVLMLARPGDADAARAMCGPAGDVRVMPLPLDDSWIRDTGPLFVRERSGAWSGVDAVFNGWGGKFVPYDHDARLAEQLLDRVGLGRRELGLVLEGGAITVDGDGTLITTESVLLNANRNPTLARGEVARRLAEHLGAERVIWLAGGLVEDRDTDGHVDNVCHFAAPGRVLVQAVSPDDPDAAVLEENLRRLRSARDALGRALEVIELPWLPRLPGVQPATAVPYMNFYLANGAVIVPVCQDASEDQALGLLASVFSDREVVPVPGAVLARGGGGVHCITQQVPSGVGIFGG